MVTVSRLRPGIPTWVGHVDDGFVLRPGAGAHLGPALEPGGSVESEARLTDFGLSFVFALRDLCFDTGKAIVKPESEPTLMQMVKLLQQNASELSAPARRSRWGCAIRGRMSSLLGQLKSLASPSQILPLWKLLKSVPGRGVIMGRLAGQLAAYTGTIRPEVVSLEKGVARVVMRDTRHVRNHLNSLHAAALMNLAEMTTGMAVISALPEGLRGIPTHVAMDYLKKARGPITAECTCAPVTSSQPQNLEVVAELKNEAGEVVARALAKWRIGA